MNNIEIIEEFIEQYNASYPDEKEWVAIYPEQIEAIENLIQYNKKLKERCKELIKEKQELTTIIEDDCIPKSKVKEKINKIQELQINYVDGITFDHIILKLEELLEGE